MTQGDIDRGQVIVLVGFAPLKPAEFVIVRIQQTVGQTSDADPRRSTMPAPLFPANAHRYDPYRTFKFQVLIDGKLVAGLRKMGALKRTTEAVKWRAPATRRSSGSCPAARASNRCRSSRV